MSNSIVPNFLPPPYNFTTEENENEDEYDTEEENEEEYDKEEPYKGSFVLSVFCIFGISLAIYRLMDSDVNVEFKFTVSKSKNKS